MNWHYDELERMDTWDIKTEIHKLEKEGFSYASCPKESWHAVVDFCDSFKARDAFNRDTFCNIYRFNIDSIWKSTESLKAEFGNREVLLEAKAIRFYALNRFLEDEKFVKEYGLKEIENSIGMGEGKVAKMILNGEPIPGEYIGRKINLDGFSMMAL